MEPILAWLAGHLGGRGVDFVLDRVLARDLTSQLVRECEDWAEGLPVGQRLEPLSLFSGASIDIDPTKEPARAALWSSLEAGMVPAVNSWLIALLERWRFVRDLQGKDGQDFYQQDEEDIVPHLNQLALRLAAVCRAHDDLFGRYVSHLLDFISTRSIKISDQLNGLLQNSRQDARDANRRYRTPRLLVSLLSSESGFTRMCFNKASPGLGEILVVDLAKYVDQDEFQAFDWADHPLIMESQIIAREEGAATVSERHLLLAVLRGGSATVAALAKRIGDDVLGEVTKIAEESSVVDFGIGSTPFGGKDQVNGRD